jgi:hypothetical protein
MNNHYCYNCSIESCKARVSLISYQLINHPPKRRDVFIRVRLKIFDQLNFFHPCNLFNFLFL